MRQQLVINKQLCGREAGDPVAKKQATIARTGFLCEPPGFCDRTSVFLQRTVGTPRNENHPVDWRSPPGVSGCPENAGIPFVQGALGSPSIPLDEATREFMEPRFGHDFGRVRVHNGDFAACTNRALNARAYTVGEHILFGAGEYAPDTRTGQRMLAHELCHVVQQREGLVEGCPGSEGIRVSDPQDRFEHAAEVVANRVTDTSNEPAPSQEVLTASRAGAGAGPKVTTRGPTRRMAIVQRYLAGSEGHGGIEEDALHEAGLSRPDAKLAYYGNWLRDLSQIDDGEAIHEIIRILATGEFGRAPTDAEIGHYLASEHVDRPDKGGTAEDPLLSAKEREAKTRALVGEQRRWVKEQQSAQFRDLIQQRADISGLPRWIEVGKEHAKRKLAEAVALGHTPEGLQALGNGLHAVEDYYSHSNFIEVALAQLVQEGNLASDNPLVAAIRRYIGVDPSNVQDRFGAPTVDRFGRPRIVTGTSVGWGANLVGLWETIKTEIKTGELRNAFVRGLAIRYGWRGIGGAGRSVLGKIGGAVGGVLGFIGGGLRWLGGTIGGLFAGAGAGAASAWHSAKHWWQKPFAALGGLFGGAALGATLGAGSTAGPVAGAVGGWRTGERIGGAIGQGVFGAAGAAITGVGGASLTLLGSTLLAAVDRTIGKAIIPFGTRASIKAAPYGSGPTHSQIAKDDPDHPLFGASRALAHEADLQIGRAIIEAWNGTGSIETRAARVKALVDLYVAHPYAVAWWRSVLLPVALAASVRQPGHHPLVR